MTPRSPPKTDRLGYHFLKLPRELRDLIYPYFIPREAPTPLTDTYVKPALWHPSIKEELLEAEFTYNTFIVKFSHSSSDGSSELSASARMHYGNLRNELLQFSIWNPHAEYRKFIRHLIINTKEVALEDTDLLSLEHECTVTRPEVREEWEELLELPRLESLTINMDKVLPNRFSWANFSPILYELRSKLPKLDLTFNLTFDGLLKFHWNSDVWFHPSNVGNTYEPMGFVDISDFVAPPSDYDKEYVETYIPDKKQQTSGRDIVEGLLAETVSNRRLLAPYYVTREPNLTRVLMEEHWDIYKKCKQERAETKEPNGSSKSSFVTSKN